jgi:hypothetical protein
LVVLVQRCWADAPEDRPTVRERLVCLRDLVQPELEPEPEPDHPVAVGGLGLPPHRAAPVPVAAAHDNAGLDDEAALRAAMVASMAEQDDRQRQQHQDREQQQQERERLQQEQQRWEQEQQREEMRRAGTQASLSVAVEGYCVLEPVLSTRACR